MTAKNVYVGYCDFINFKDSEEGNPQLLWPEEKQGQKTIRKLRRDEPYFAEYQPSAQSSLQQTALLRVRQDKQKLQKNAIGEYLSRTTSSNFLLTRENTQPNNISISKKKKQKPSTQELALNIQKNKTDEENEFDDLILYPHLIGLSQLVFAQVMGKQRKINKNLLYSWRGCLELEDNQEIYGPNASYTFSRIFPIDELERGFNEIYGTGKKRCLRIGEQALLIFHMNKYLQKCENKITKIARKQYDIIPDILKSAKLEELQSMSVCMKQIELIWKIIATQWRYSGKLQKNNKLIENSLFNGKSNFIDLRKENNVTAFLLAHSNKTKQKLKAGETKMINEEQQL